MTFLETITASCVYRYTVNHFLIWRIISLKFCIYLFQDSDKLNVHVTMHIAQGVLSVAELWLKGKLS